MATTELDKLAARLGVSQPSTSKASGNSTSELDKLASRLGALSGNTSASHPVTQTTPAVPQTSVEERLAAVESELKRITNMSGTFDVSPYTQEELDTAEVRRQELEKERTQLLAEKAQTDPSMDQRIGKGAQAIGTTIAAAPRVLWDTTKQYFQNAREESQNEDRQRISTELENTLSQMHYMENYYRNFGFSSKAEAQASEKWQELNAKYQQLSQQLKGTEVNTPVSMDTKGMQMMQEAGQQREAALVGLGKTGRFVGDTLISVGQNVAMLPLAAINPVLPALAMGVTASGSRAAELNAQGADPGSALTRGIVSGTIESLTEKLPIDTVLDLIKTGGKGIVVNLLKQAGIEATEEGVSYALNFLADKAAKDPNATFTLSELGYAMASGGFSGLLMGGGATAVNRVQALPVAPRKAQNVFALPVGEQVQAERTDTVAKNDGIVYNGFDISEKTSQKYWRPTLTKEEWRLLNYKMNNAGIELDESTYWVYASEKGTSVFSIYGVGDGTDNTPLYASGGKTAEADAAKFKDYLEGRKNGTYTGAEVFDRWVDDMQSARKNGGGNLHDLANRRTDVGNVRASGDTQVRAGGGSAVRSKSNLGIGEISNASVNTKLSTTPETSVGAATPQFPYREADTQSYANRLFTEGEIEANPELGGTTHKVYTNAEARSDAEQRLNWDYAGEMDALRSSEEWGAAEQFMAASILEKLTDDARKTGDYSEAVAWKKLVDEKGTIAGQSLQARKAIVDSVPYIVAEAAETLDSDKTRKLAPPKKAKIMQDVATQAKAYNEIQPGDIDSLINLIERNNEIRKTTGLFAKKTSKQMDKALRALAEMSPDAEQFLRDVAVSQIRSIASDYSQLSTLEAIKSYRVMSMLSKPSTILRNLVGNAVMDPMDTTANNLAVLFDKVISQKTGTRSVAYQQGALRSKEKRDGMTIGALKSFIEVGLDADTSDATSRYEQRSGRTFKMTGNIAERLLSTWAKYSNYAMTTTDQMQKGGIEAETARGLQELAQQGKYRVSPAKGQSAEQAINDSIKSRATEVAKQRTFQDDSTLAGVAVGARDTLNKIHITDRQGGTLGAGDLAVTFAKAPANLVARAAEYSPVGLAKSVADVAKVMSADKGSVSPEVQAQAVTNLARGLSGTTIISVFTALALKGLLSVAGDNDKDREALDRAEGKTGTQWNLSATVRWLNGESADWKSGDTLMSIGFLEPLNALMAIGALIADAYEEDGTLSVGNVVGSSASGILQAVLDLPVMSSVKTLMDSYNYSEGDTVAERAADAGLGYLGSQLSSFIPNAIKGIATGTDTSVRTTYGDNLLQDVKGSVFASLPILRQKLPASLDNFGRERTYNASPVMHFLNQNVLPGQITTYGQDKVGAELERVYNATGDASVYPDRSAPSSVTYNSRSYSLTTEEQRQYQEAAGDILIPLIQQLSGTGLYRNASMEQRAEILSDAISLSEGEAKKEILQAKGISQKASSREKFGVSSYSYILYKVATKGIESDTDWRGNSVSGSKRDKTVAAIDSLDIPTDQKDALYLMAGYAEKELWKAPWN